VSAWISWYFTKKCQNIYVHQNLNVNAFPNSYIVFKVMHELKLFKVNYLNIFHVKAANIKCHYLNLLDLRLQCFTHFVFLWEKYSQNPVNKDWITTGIKTSRLHKRELYLISRNSNNPQLKMHYKSYCKILSNVIKAAKKKLHYNSQIINSNNRIKTMRNVVKSETGTKKTAILVYIS
jgi:hypothetical protein